MKDDGAQASRQHAVCVCCADLQKGVALASPSIVPSADLQKGVACPSIVSAEFANGEREIGTRRFPKPMGVCPSVFDIVGCFRCKNSLRRRVLSLTPCMQKAKQPRESVAQCMSAMQSRCAERFVLALAIVQGLGREWKTQRR